MGGYCEIDMGGSEEVRLRTRPSDRQKLWVTRGDRWGASDPDRRLNTSANQRRGQRRVEEGSPNPDGLGDFSGGHKHIPADDATSTHSASVDLGDRAIDPGDEEVCIKESGDLYAEDVERHLAVP
ncbi:unnamed protein product [Phytophthora fragariaefolia]|uniref:Unnamed protein product n=1 Tax=Phytophthora fragariaefolia TaxID=1490495 RepID=A0A9W7D4I8_9STRA|nr:unnamed protein product [Phytophthora fragariaefolia]